MQGDLTTTPKGHSSQLAGMIPRILFKLFQHLEGTTTDFSVKISVELYNEELRDLLAPGLDASSGSNQPMGLGAPTGSSSAGSPEAFLRREEGTVSSSRARKRPLLGLLRTHSPS